MTYPRPHSYQAAELGWAPRQKTAEFQSLLVGGAAPHPYQPNSFRLPGSSNRPRGEKHEESWALGLSPGPNAGLLSDFAKSHALSLAFSFLMCKMRVWFFFFGLDNGGGRAPHDRSHHKGQILWAPAPTLPLICCVASGKGLSPLGLRFPGSDTRMAVWASRQCHWVKADHAGTRCPVRRGTRRSPRADPASEAADLWPAGQS